MNRIDELFARCREENRAALILYLTSGFPDAETTKALLPVLAESGADLIELGVPFSDPIADGPTIQKASSIALERGMSFTGTLELLSEFRKSHQTPVVLFGALNPFLAHGLEESSRLAKDAGADGFLAADLPAEEAAEFRAACQPQGLHLVPLIAPTTSNERIAAIAEHAGGFLYCIARRGITGAHSDVDQSVLDYLDRVQANANLPLAVGFGIATPDDVRSLAPHADGVVVGSALIKLIGKCQDEGLDVKQEVAAYVQSLAKACNRA
ncbi:tryptophan synthase subunit alpha [bacterium]|nr:tryptophan synthase subunit alpha [bacterium]